MSDIEHKRAFVGEMYSSASWKKKVQRMSDAQIFAIYMREQHKANGKHEEPPKESDDAQPPF